MLPLVLMIIAALVLLGLALGSFANALVWRLHEQSRKQNIKDKEKKQLSPTDLSILKGRSMCIYCQHKLVWQDLIPVLSWVGLKGRCRYCQRPISWQYPAVELIMTALFISSYLFWSYGFEAEGVVRFVIWLPSMVLLVALAVYDLRWRLLPNKLTFVFLTLTIGQVVLLSLLFGMGLQPFRGAAIGFLCLGGLFYGLFQFSGGKWIGGGDVKLGFGLGILTGSALGAIALLLIASLVGSLTAMVLLFRGKLAKNHQIPFGPFLITAAIVIQIFGERLLSWYTTHILFI